MNTICPRAVHMLLPILRLLTQKFELQISWSDRFTSILSLSVLFIVRFLSVVRTGGLNHRERERDAKVRLKVVM